MTVVPVAADLCLSMLSFTAVSCLYKSSDSMNMGLSTAFNFPLL